MSQWTKKAIMECFSRQIETIPLDRITVKGIVADCGVTRNTFYYHFEDVFALAKEVLQERLEQMSDPALSGSDWESYLLLLAKQISQNRRTIRNLFHSTKSQEIKLFVEEILSETLGYLFDHLAAGKTIDAQERKAVVDFYRHAVSGFTVDWFEKHADEDPAPLINHISTLVQDGMRSAIAHF